MNLFGRVKDLLQRSASTDALPPRDHTKQAHIVHERAEALSLLRAANEQLEAKTLEFLALEARLFELSTLAARGLTGHDWRDEFESKEHASAFYQSLTSLMRYIRDRSRLAQMMRS
jgi:hypothetical protein